MKLKLTIFLISTTGFLTVWCGSGGGDDEECGEVCGRIWECENELVTEMSQEEFSGYFGENQEECNEDIGEICSEGELSEDCLGCFDGSVSCDGLLECLMEYCEGGEGGDRPAGLPCEMDPPANIDPTAEVSFSPDHMPCVDIQMTPEDWTALMEEVFDEQALLQSIDRMEEQMSSAQEPDDGYDEAVAGLRAWVQDRRAMVVDQLATGIPTGAAEQGDCD